MKNLGIFAMALATVVASTTVGCEAVKNTNNTQRGVAIGTASGAVLGGVLGNNVGKGGNTALGAILGGVVGGVAGGVIGNKMDKQARELDEALPGAEVERVGEGIKLTLKENAVRFETNKSALTAQAKENLDKLIPVFKEHNQTDIVIYGYTDSTGKEDYNLTLSEQRAASVRTYLVSKGIASSRITTKGMGIADPIASNETVEGRSQNRRVEFAITANEQMIKEAQEQAK